MKEKYLKINFRGRGGITLIALVVTIIVLLILAGVAIVTLTGDNGIITRTSTAKKSMEEAEIKETIKLAYQNALLGQYAGANETFADVMQGDLEKVYGTGKVAVEKEGTDYIITIMGKGKYKIDVNGEVSKKAAITLSEEQITVKIVDGVVSPKNLTATFDGVEGDISWELEGSEKSKITLTPSGDKKSASISATETTSSDVTVIVSCGGKTATCTVRVISVVSVSEITNITPTSATLTRGSNTQTIVATVNSGATEPLTWTSSSEYITISQPTVNGNTQTVTLTVSDQAPAGDVTITAQNEKTNLNANNTVTITINVPVTGVILRETGENTNLSSTDTVTIAKNGTKSFTATVVPTGASIQGITWSIENANPSGVITLPNPATSTSGNGLVVSTGENKTGTATLKATATGTEISATCGISVEPVLTFTPVTAPTAENSTTCVGCYASIDEDNKPDGIIYADLGKGNQNKDGNETVEGSGLGLGVNYSFAAVTEGLNSYVISNETVSGSMGERRLIKLANNNTGTTKRFHIMGLVNIKDNNNNVSVNWYYQADDRMTNWNTITSTAFGAGITNTERMTKDYTIEVGKSYSYGDPAVDYGIVQQGDMWPYVTNGWYVPSKLEWAAFVGELGVTSSNRGTGTGSGNYYGLRRCYWTSSQWNRRNATYVDLDSENFDINVMVNSESVRLGKIF